MRSGVACKGPRGDASTFNSLKPKPARTFGPNVSTSRWAISQHAGRNRCTSGELAKSRACRC
jgi:hypothetical protein